MKNTLKNSLKLGLTAASIAVLSAWAAAAVVRHLE